MPSRSNRSSGGSKSDYNDIGYNRGAQSGYNTASSGGYNHGAGSKRKSHYQKSTYQKSNYRSDGRTKKYHGADRKSKPRAASSRIDSPPEEILLIGDSMLRNIDPDGYKQAVWLFSYPGINASQVWFLKFRFSTLTTRGPRTTKYTSRDGLMQVIFEDYIRLMVS